MMMRRLAQFDFFYKIEDTYKKQTERGGILSLLVFALLAFLLVSEIWDYLTLKHEYEFLVDNSMRAIHDHLELNIDITVAMKCDYLAVILIDSGGLMIDASQSFFKTETSMSSVMLQNEEQEDFFNNKKDYDLNIQKVIKNAYKEEEKKDWNILKMFGSAGSKFFSNQEACRIHGSTLLNKVAGKFMINIFGHGNFGPHVDHSNINLTHVISKLQFGKNYPGLRNPLDGLVKTATMTFETYNYYLSVVPTIFVDRRQNVLLTSQYAVTEHERQYEYEDLSAVRSTPGIYFNYDLEPISVRITESTTTLTVFLIRVLAISSGIFYLIDFIYTFLIK